MGWPKGTSEDDGEENLRKKYPKLFFPYDEKSVSDMQEEIELLHAALKQLIRENRAWRSKVNEAIKLLNLRVDCPAVDFSIDSGSVRGLRPVPDNRDTANSICVDSGYGSGDRQLAASDD